VLSHGAHSGKMTVLTKAFLIAIVAENGNNYFSDLGNFKLSTNKCDILYSYFWKYDRYQNL